ncbi:MAG TPA: hypothetical protein PLP17_02705, partial [Oligoflexia bacterium]|nr:hypothetical protein [Oligoflexia bacterium]
MNAIKQLHTRAELQAGFDEAIAGLRFVDLHVHDMPSCCGENLALQGPDAMIDYHYLYGEVFGGLSVSAARAKELWVMPRSARVDWLVENSLADGCLPVSEARLGILTAAHVLGLPTDSGDFRRVLREWRTLFADLGPARYTDRIFELAGIDQVVSTQSPFVAAECELYLRDNVLERWDPRYLCGLRWD